MKNKKKIGPPPITTNLTKLADESVPFVKVTKDGNYIPKAKKKGATHKVEETANSVLIEPLAKWPKHKNPEKAYGAPRIPDEINHAAETAKITTASWHPPIPEGTTWLEYRSGNTIVCEEIRFLHEYENRRGTLRFGKLRYGDTFVSLMPEDQQDDARRIAENVTKFQRPKLPKAAPSPAQGEKRAPTPAKPRANDVPGQRQNGVAKPGAGSKTGQVWEIADATLVKVNIHGGELQKQTLAACEKAGISKGTAATQFSAWRRFYGHPKN